MKEQVSTKNAPQAIGPYSQAIKVGKFLFTSGQIPIDPVNGELVTGDIGEQTRQVLKNLHEVLLAGGSSLENVVKTTVFVKNMADFEAINGIYAEFFLNNPPARSLVEVARLPKDVGIEIEAIALLK